MKKIALLYLLMSQGVWADAPPPVPEGGLSLVYQSECSDAETGEAGTCYLMQAVDGTMYLTF